MSQHLNQIELFQDEKEEWRWRVVVTPGTPGGTEPDIIAISPDGYKNKKDMIASFFRILFGEWNDSFLAAYNEWGPEHDIQSDDLEDNPQQS